MTYTCNYSYSCTCKFVLSYVICIHMTVSVRDSVVVEQLGWSVQSAKMQWKILRSLEDDPKGFLTETLYPQWNEMTVLIKIYIAHESNIKYYLIVFYFRGPKMWFCCYVFESGGSGRNSLVEYWLLQGFTNNSAAIQRLLHDLQARNWICKKQTAFLFILNSAFKEKLKSMQTWHFLLSWWK